MARYINDGSGAKPTLQVYLNMDNLKELRADTIWPGLHGVAAYVQIAADGFEGIQLTTDDVLLPVMQFPYCGLDRVNVPADAERIAAKHAERGDLCVTLHVGWGMEDEDEVSRLVDAVLTASERHRLPMFIETHRATITQDLWRTVQITSRFPEVRFNGDFSHYYCGQELVYGDWAAKLAFMEPIFERIGFLHGRIASPGCMQVAIDSDIHVRPLHASGDVDFLAHFRELWCRAMAGFLHAAGPGDILIFAPELLRSGIYYARSYHDASGSLIEESDRYHQALLLRDLARECFVEAEQQVASLPPISGSRSVIS